MSYKKESCLGVFSLETASWIIAFLQFFHNGFYILNDITVFKSSISLEDPDRTATAVMAFTLLGSIVADCAAICGALLLAIGNCV